MLPKPHIGKAYLIFPYLKTTDVVRFGPLHVHPYNHSQSIEDVDKGALEVLLPMFYLRENARFPSPSFAVLTGDVPTIEEKLRAARDLQTLLAYYYAGPSRRRDDPILQPEQATLFLFQEERVPLGLLIPHGAKLEGESPYTYAEDPNGFVPGFVGVMNFQEHLWVARGSRIYPPIHNLFAADWQDLAVDLGREEMKPMFRPIFDVVTALYLPPHVKERILLSMQWYNRARACSRGDDTAIALLATAFEALFGLHGKLRTTERFVESVCVLLGNYPRLDLWCNQFYNVRSSVVHDGRAKSLGIRISPTKSPQGQTQEFYSILDYGFGVYRACCSTIASGFLIADRLGLANKLTANSERFRLICETLSKATKVDVLLIRSLDSIIDDLDLCSDHRDTGLTIEGILGTIKTFCETYLVPVQECTLPGADLPRPNEKSATI